jgi:hypothetical protein
MTNKPMTLRSWLLLVLLFAATAVTLYNIVYGIFTGGFAF